MPSDIPNFVDCLFRRLRPPLIIISTPNRDFNVLFPGWQHGQMRDSDHKFELNQQEFQQWFALPTSTQSHQIRATITSLAHDYSVTFDGVGTADTKKVNPQLGFCTQIAIFELCNRELKENLDSPMNSSQPSASQLWQIPQKSLSSKLSQFVSTPAKLPSPRSESYKLLATIDYPWFDVPETTLTSAYIEAQVHEGLMILSRRSNEVLLSVPVDELWQLLSVRQVCRGEIQVLERELKPVEGRIEVPKNLQEKMLVAISVDTNHQHHDLPPPLTASLPLDDTYLNVDASEFYWPVTGDPDLNPDDIAWT